jgi:HK97 family phage prohead protease
MKKEKRDIIFKNIEIRSSVTDGGKYIEGIIPYNSKSAPIWGVTEIIERSAFNKTIKDQSEVCAFWNHDDSLILGNTKSGTLELEDSEGGLICRCKLPQTTYASDLYEIITRGDVKTMSFGFRPIKWADTENGKLRTLKEVHLTEVSFGVPYAAYKETNSQTYMRGFMKRKIDIETVNEILEKGELTEEDVTGLQETVNTLTAIIKENSPKEEGEAAPAEPETTTPAGKGTPPDPKEDKNTEKEAINQEIPGLIDTLFEIEKTGSETSEKEEPNG